MTIRENLLRVARNLKSEGGENPEYDRALVEVLMDFLGYEREEAEKLLGLSVNKERELLRTQTWDALLALDGAFPEEVKPLLDRWIEEARK